MERLDVNVDGRGILAAIGILPPAIVNHRIYANHLFSLRIDSATARRVSVLARRGTYFTRPLVGRSLSVLREENAVAFAADLGVVDLRRCRIGDKTETMSGTLGRGCGDGNGDHPDLEEVPGKMVRRVVDAHEALCNASPLDFNRINPPTHVSKRAVRAYAVGYREGVEYRADVFRVEFCDAIVQIHFAATFRHRSRPECKALRGASIPGVIASRARRARRVKSYEGLRAPMFEPVNRYESALKEPPVGMEMVRDALPSFEVRPHAVKVQVGLGNYSLKVGDGGRVKAREGKVGERGWSTAVGGSREEEVSRARNVRDRSRVGFALIVSSFILVVRKRRQSQPRAEHESSSGGGTGSPSDEIASG